MRNVGQCYYNAVGEVVLLNLLVRPPAPSVGLPDGVTPPPPTTRVAMCLLQRAGRQAPPVLHFRTDVVTSRFVRPFASRSFPLSAVRTAQESP